MSDALFLSEDEVAELTGIVRGARGKPKHLLQIAQLRAMRVPFVVNARGRPIIVRQVLQGSQQPMPAATEWQPAVLAR